MWKNPQSMGSSRPSKHLPKPGPLVHRNPRGHAGRGRTSLYLDFQNFSHWSSSSFGPGRLSDAWSRSTVGNDIGKPGMVCWGVFCWFWISWKWKFTYRRIHNSFLCGYLWMLGELYHLCSIICFNKVGWVNYKAGMIFCLNITDCEAVQPCQPLGELQKATGHNWYFYPLEVEHSPWKMMVGRLLSYWEGNFWGAMLNFGRV